MDLLLRGPAWRDPRDLNLAVLVHVPFNGGDILTSQIRNRVRNVWWRALLLQRLYLATSSIDESATELSLSLQHERGRYCRQCWSSLICSPSAANWKHSCFSLYVDTREQIAGSVVRPGYLVGSAIQMLQLQSHSRFHKDNYSTVLLHYLLFYAAYACRKSLNFIQSVVHCIITIK